MMTPEGDVEATALRAQTRNGHPQGVHPAPSTGRLGEPNTQSVQVRDV